MVITSISNKLHCFTLAFLLSTGLFLGVTYSTNTYAAVEICNGVDDDGDGLKDEGFADFDLDGRANCVDTDDDGDGIVDSRDLDDDGDGVPDIADNDDDNDGTPDSINADDDNDGIPDSTDPDDNNDGILDANDRDDDDDGAPDALDVDDNNDGTPEQEVCNGLDDDNDGSTDENFADLDNDGQKNCVDANDDNDALPDSTDTDNDNDGIGDVVDLDDDNDGVAEVELCNGVDDDSDRLIDEGFDADRDGIPSCRDADDDNDGDADTNDSDDNGNGIEETETCNGLDDDQNGLVDDEIAGDLDNDGRSNCIDVDDDNDGISDSEDADNDNDGTPDSIDNDDDNNGVADVVDLDADNDGLDNIADTDDDNDGFADSTERAAGTGINNANSEPIYVKRINLTPVDSLRNPALASVQGLTYVGDHVVALATNLSAQPILALIDTASGVVEASYPLSANYSAITTDGSSYYVLDRSTTPATIKVLDATGGLLSTLDTPTLVDPVGLGYDGRLLVTDNGGSPLIRFLDTDSGSELATYGISASIDVEMVDGALLSVYPNGGVYLVDTSLCNGYPSGTNDVDICTITPDQLLFTVTGSSGIATDGVNVFAAGSPPVAPASSTSLATVSAASAVVISRTVPLNPASPDLSMTAVTPTTVSVRAGGALMVSNTVGKQGGSTSIGFPIAFRLSTDAIYGNADDRFVPFVRSVAPMAAAATSAATSSLIIPRTMPAGMYYVCAKADPGNAVNELNESNNSRCSATRVTVVLLPDLLPGTVSLVQSGRSLTIQDSVRNAGTLGAGAFTVRYSAQRVPSIGQTIAYPKVAICSRDVASLSAGALNSGVLTCNLSALAVAYYRIWVEDDSAKVITEFIESNNSRIVGIANVR